MKKKIAIGLTISLIILWGIFLVVWYTTDKNQMSDAPIQVAQETDVEPSTIEVTTGKTPEVSKGDIQGALAFLDFLDESENVPSNTEKNTGEKDNANDLSVDDETPTQENSKELLELVREGIAYHDQLLYSGSADMTIEESLMGDMLLPDPDMYSIKHGTWEVAFSFSGPKMYYAVEGDVAMTDGFNQLQNYEYSFDGETAEELRRTPNASHLSIYDDPSKSRLGSPAFFDPRYWGWSVGDEPLGSIFDAFNVTSVSPGSLDGSDFMVVEGNVSGGPMNVEMWVNPSKGYRPERFEFYLTDNDKEIRVTRSYSLNEYAPDIWFPEAATEITRETNPNTGESTILRRRDVRISNIAINTSVDESSFYIEREKGLKVYDNRSHTQYTVE